MTQARSTGRPKKEADMSRTYRLAVMMSPAQIEELDKMASYPGQDRAEIVRRLIGDAARQRESAS